MSMLLQLVAAKAGVFDWFVNRVPATNCALKRYLQTCRQIRADEEGIICFHGKSITSRLMRRFK